jgi:hypothetical protein
MKTPPPKPGPSGPQASAAQFRMKEEADKRKKKPSAIQSLAGAMANAAVGQARSMAGTAGRVAKAPGNVARSMAGTAGRVAKAPGNVARSMAGNAGRVGRAVNPFD